MKFWNCACKTMSSVSVRLNTAAANKCWMWHGSCENDGDLHINFFSMLNIQFGVQVE